jgi:hypothetical protein
MRKIIVLVNLEEMLLIKLGIYSLHYIPNLLVSSRMKTKIRIKKILLSKKKADLLSKKLEILSLKKWAALIILEITQISQLLIMMKFLQKTTTIEILINIIKTKLTMFLEKRK